jgi:FtsP/CotA-like multicopper oxidase with cupredoxin domain
MKRKIIIVSILIISIIVVTMASFRIDFDIFRNQNQNYESELPEVVGNRPQLFIPDLVDMTADGSEFEITVDETEFEFFNGYSTQVKSYNEQGYLGKTIKLKDGSTFYPTITNNLQEVTTVHWHGLEINGENDGAMGSVAEVQPGVSKTYELSVNQHASTIWYHPHAKGFTASQAYEGLAGMIIIEDELSSTLGLPNDYGVNDLPVVLQAKLFDSEGNLNYGNEVQNEGNREGNNALFNGLLNFEDETGDNVDTTEGFIIMTNGLYEPIQEATNEVIRLRLLNGSNHGIMDLSTEDGTPIYVIGTDGGLLESPQNLDLVEIAAGQRFEILIDLTEKEIGDTVDIIANEQVVLSLVINEESKKVSEIPNQLVEITPFEDYDNQEVTHTFNLGRNTINGKQMDMMRIDETFIKDEVYYFEVVNQDDENHSFHIHNSQFLIVEKNDETIDYEKVGWKDTIYLEPGESMKLQVSFKNTGDFMYHCHILIHEEKGMMGTFRVID